MIGHTMGGYEIVAAAPGARGEYVILAVRSEPDVEYVTALVAAREMPTPVEWFWGHYLKNQAKAYEDFYDRIPYKPEPVEPTKPHVELLHVRHPDEGCFINVLIDGTEAKFTEVDVDPGRGYTRSDWNDSAEFHGTNPAYSEAFRDIRAGAYEGAGDSQYIDDSEEENS
jgi:hypothetical protein